jgi:hypothetical protein
LEDADKKLLVHPIGALPCITARRWLVAYPYLKRAWFSEYDAPLTRTRLLRSPPVLPPAATPLSRSSPTVLYPVRLSLVVYAHHRFPRCSPRLRLRFDTCSPSTVSPPRMRATRPSIVLRHRCPTLLIRQCLKKENVFLAFKKRTRQH